MRKKLIPIICCLGLFLGCHSSFASEMIDANSLNYELQAIHSQAPNLKPKVLRLALTAYHHARAMGLDHKQVLTIIDYSVDSTRPRMWVVDLKHLLVPYNTLVAHGQNSGYSSPNFFSNQPKSLASSIGVFLTENTYSGHNGISLKLKGLERGVNDLAEARQIVMHGAWYVSEQFARAYGRLGRSFGCPAISQTVAKPVINTIKNGTILFAYYPQQQWLARSRFLA